MRILGIDFGDNRTGIAISDPLGWTAQGLEVFKGGISAAASRIARLAKQHGADAIIVGYPLNMDGSAGFRAERTDRFIALLKEQISNESGRAGGGIGGKAGEDGGDGVSDSGDGAGDTAAIIKWDERLSSAEAARALKTTGIKPTSRGTREKGKLDIVAATIILQSYLDSIKRTDGSITEGEQLQNER